MVSLEKLFPLTAVWLSLGTGLGQTNAPWKHPFVAHITHEGLRNRIQKATGTREAGLL